MPYYQERYDALIVDEGQDFKEFWYELIFKLIPDGRRLICLDEMQNIFGHYTDMPEAPSFSRFNLRKNCRNSKSIVRYLSNLVGVNIQAFAASPEGAEIIEMNFNSKSDQLHFLESELRELIRNQNIDPSQILILLNTPRADSCIHKREIIAGLPLIGLDNKARLNRDSLHFTSIKTFKGLESDIIFLLDVHSLSEELKLRSLYTQCSRARSVLYVL